MVQTLLKKTLKEIPAGAPAGVCTIAEEFASKLTSDDTAHFEPALLANIAQTHYKMAQSRKRGKPKIQIYCPVYPERTTLKTIIDVVSDDMAFLIDSVVAEINKNNFLIDLMIHPIVYTTYDKSGDIQDLSGKPLKKSVRQSHVHIHIKDNLSSEDMKNLEDGLYKTLEDVSIANRDWKQMLGKLKEARDELANARIKRPAAEVEQYCAFLDYLYNNNFTLLGYREYEFVEKEKVLKSKTVKGTSLGLLNGDLRTAFISEDAEGLPRNLQELRRRLPPVSVSKTNRLSTVHRLVPMDAIAIKTYDHDGSVKGEKLFLGLFTSVTYSRSVSDVPFLREKVEEVMEMSNFLPGSHDRKAMRHILEKYPRDELFQIPKEELFQICLDILRLQERQRVALFLREDLFGRYISCLVYVPRDRFGTKLRKRIGEILQEELNGVLSNFYTSMDDSLFARAMFVINISQKNPPKYDVKELEEKIQEISQTWQERLSEAMSDVIEDQKKITVLTHTYGEAFPVSYTSRYTGKQAIFDIYKIEEAIACGQTSIDLYRPEEDDPYQMRLKLYNLGEPINLSDILPILENMGLRAIAELPFEIKPENFEGSIWVHDFLLETNRLHKPVAIDPIKKQFETAFIKIWTKKVASDDLNRLILSSGMSWQEVMILRCYVKYLKQLRFSYSQVYVAQTLTENPEISHSLVKLFQAYHNPHEQKNAETLTKKYDQQILKSLEKVEQLDQDQILRGVRDIIHATLRTNYYQMQEDGSPKFYLSVKLDTQKIALVPEPRPYREIFVYSPHFEAVHLRGDEIARGGLRWSDRHEDFRTEVLGLMKAQMVKNAVIVPMGAKGGFVIKKNFTDRKEMLEEGIACYKNFIRALLDITDNIKNKKVVYPENVVRRDGDDPYLVVAADKGTATFSDIANTVAMEEYDFWLGDAFASGGSAGYDHKKMGITARGAWESVKLHFRELNHDTQTQPFDVIGVGDMGGDVFGNGMLLSEKIRLIGAFNHLHIFCDPDPDLEASYKERKRLFKNVKGWDEYNENLLSKGGKIFLRSEKSLKLTPEIKKRFDLEDDTVSPNELMSAMLCARTDLLWFGGIGTYIKSSHETHAQVGDKANDNIRANASEIRAKVISEGANLGVTQPGRIEFAKKGGKINTDFLDNSGGVDSSDHEVNIKILLSEVMRQKSSKMTIESRNVLLEKMTNEVASHVLRNNYQQALAISKAAMKAPKNLKSQEEFIKELEKTQGLNRKIEALPDADEFAERARLNKGLTRPELCVLLSYAKISFTRDLLASDIPDSKDMQYWLLNYFPDILQEKYADQIKAHRLSREIIATQISNSLVNRLGPTFIKSRREKTGADCEEIAKAYIIVREAFALRQIWDSIEALDNNVPASVQLRAMDEIAKLAEHVITWFLNQGSDTIDMSQTIQEFSPDIKTLNKNFSKLLSGKLKEDIDQRANAYVQDGLPKALAEKIALMPTLAAVCDIIRISHETKADLLEAANIYFRTGEIFNLDWLRQQARFITSEDSWYNEATAGIVDQLYACQAGLTYSILSEAPPAPRKTSAKKPAQKVKTDALAAWMEKRKKQIRQIENMFEELHSIGTLDLPMLVIAEQRIQQLHQN